MHLPTLYHLSYWYFPHNIGTVYVEELLPEAQMMIKLRHPNLLQLYGVCTLEEPIYIVSEFMNHGSLLEYLRSGDGHSLTLNQMIDIMAQIAVG